MQKEIIPVKRISADFKFTSKFKYLWLLSFAVCVCISMFLLFKAIRDEKAIPVWTAYAVGEPSENMAQIAEQRGIQVWQAVAEYLPTESELFDCALLVTTVCFLIDIPKAFSEIRLILKPKGKIILAIIDKNSEFCQSFGIFGAFNMFRTSFHVSYRKCTFLWIDLRENVK
ncbi:MAG: methyltransferase domain-containing protein [Aequorivita sp.]